MTNVIYLLWCWYNPSDTKVAGFTFRGLSSTKLKGAYTTEEEAKYYCDELNKVNKIEDVKYYVEPFYCDTTFHFMDANGNDLVPKYNSKNKKYGKEKN
jgi:hypothetical protein